MLCNFDTVFKHVSIEVTDSFVSDIFIGKVPREDYGQNFRFSSPDLCADRSRSVESSLVDFQSVSCVFINTSYWKEIN